MSAASSAVRGTSAAETSDALSAADGVDLSIDGWYVLAAALSPLRARAVIGAVRTGPGRASSRLPARPAPGPPPARVPRRPAGRRWPRRPARPPGPHGPAARPRVA